MKQKKSNLNRGLQLGFALSTAVVWISAAVLWYHSMDQGKITWFVWLTVIAAVVLTVCFWLLERDLMRPMAELSDVIKNWDSTAPDELSKQISQIPGPVGELGEVFHGEMAEVERRLAGIEEKTREEITQTVRMDIAEKICGAILPRELKEYPSRQYFEVAGLVRPGRREYSVFYDFFYVDPGLVCISVGEVPGDDIYAALFMAIVQSMIRTRLRLGRSLAETMSDVNVQVYDYGYQGEVCALVGTLDAGMGYLTYVNAGICPPMIMREGGLFEPLESSVFIPLGKEQNVGYLSENTRLRQGDRLFLYTEGLEQVKNGKGNDFGGQELRDALNRSRARREPEDSLRDLSDEAAAFCTSDDDHAGYAALLLEYRKGEKELSYCRVPGTPEYAGDVLTFIKNQFDENGIQRKHYARIAVLVDELFALCCRCLEKDEELTVECGVSPDAESVTIRITGPFQGENPLADAQSGPSGQAVEFIQNHGDYVRFKAGEEYDAISVVCFI